MKFKKIFSILLTFALLISSAITPATSAMQLTENEQIENSYVENGFLIPQLDTEEYNKYILDTENYLNEHSEFKNIYDSFSDVERQHFWNSVENTRISLTNSNIDSKPSEVTPFFAPIVWFVAATCAKLIAKKLAKVTVTFTKHAIERANERKISTEQVADTITDGTKYMDKYTRARAIYDKDKNILVVFVGNTKEVTTIYK